MSFTFTNLVAASQSDQLIRGITAFSKKLGEKAKKPADNIFFSPVVIHGFISLLSQDPWFYEKNNFATSLCVPDVIVTLPCYKEIFEALNNVNNLYISNTVFLKYHSEIQNDFKNLLTNTFASDVKYLNFTEKEGATKIVNDWMHSKTHRKINSFTEITDETYMYFLNTAHLEGTWADPFSQEEIVLSAFHIDLQNIATVEMMQKKGEFYFKYDVPTGAQILKLPLANTDVSVIFILPAYNGNFPDLSQATMNMTKQETHVYLPKFKVDDVLELTDYLKEMGLNNIFDANLTGVTVGDELTFKGMQQKILLNLHEEGLEIVGATQSTLTKAHNERVSPKDGLVIYEVNMSTEISNRFATTKVVWRVKNVNKIAAETKFKVVLTENAFITEFIMQMEAKSYKSYIKKKEEAKNIYKEALRHGRSAGLVEAKTRDSQEFTVSVNVEPDSVAVFSLTYEEMLQRRHNQYELVLNICPGQIVEYIAIEVRINESRPLKFVKTPPLRSGDDLNKSQYDRAGP